MKSSSAVTGAPLLRLFVYGTLMRGGRFHDRYCKGVLAVEAASVRGRVHRLSQGYPALLVPEESILARGTGDALADARREGAIGGEIDGRDLVWSDVPGELLTFDDPQTRLPRLDRLEGFHVGAASLYQRVLLPIRRATGPWLAAWAYVEGELARRS